MPDAVKIIECPRDAWQGLSGHIPAPEKARFLQRLIDAGFTRLDAVSFVSPSAVPQMADSELVLQLVNTAPETEIIAIVVNRKGADRAIATGKVTTLGFPFSTSAEFLRRNQNQTPEQALAVFDSVRETAGAAGLGTIAYLSMSFGNPYGEPWNIETVLDACARMQDHGAALISLADTVGLANPETIAETTAAAIHACAGVKVGVHLHARPGEAAARIGAAFQAGCRRFDSALAGLGGCPFAEDRMVGNIPTEVLILTLQELGVPVPQFTDVGDLARASAAIGNRYGAQRGQSSGETL